MIALHGIHQTYAGPQGPVHALRGIDLEVRAGEIFGVIGRSGAGKSSLVRTINLLNRPTQGRVLVNGQELTALNGAGLRAARRDIGMVFQHFNLLSSRTVYDNVALPLELAGATRGEIRARVLPLLELVGLQALADRYPAQVSGGQKQRVGIARALASRPRVLLSDEATSALDPETTRSILALLLQIQRELGLTVVLITHQMQVIKQVAQRLAVMEAGQIVEQGETLQVFHQPAHEVTQRLLDDVVPRELPAPVLARVRALLGDQPTPDARLLRLVFAGRGAEQPLLSDLVRRFGLDLNIVHGQIDEVQGHPFGTLAVLAHGQAPQREAALGHLRDAGVRVEEVACA
ncbi:methionine ABC transporter ATP-binding protein [Acidovorax lacteus]|uniref:Methionine ABC transporter ATP-binding protein n=1 Tax=Acidovorax lacteus TaxID=1924988 RepID=A0ABP8LF54_9BURK